MPTKGGQGGWKNRPVEFPPEFDVIIWRMTGEQPTAA